MLGSCSLNWVNIQVIIRFQANLWKSALAFYQNTSLNVNTIILIFLKLLSSKLLRYKNDPDNLWNNQMWYLFLWSRERKPYKERSDTGKTYRHFTVSPSVLTIKLNGKINVKSQNNLNCFSNAMLCRLYKWQVSIHASSWI